MIILIASLLRDRLLAQCSVFTLHLHMTKNAVFHGFLSALGHPFFLLKKFRVRRRYFCISILLAALASVFSLFEMMFLIRLVQGVIVGNFGSLIHWYPFRVLSPAVSPIFESYSTTLVFFVIGFFLFAIITSLISYSSSISIDYQIKTADSHLRSMVFSRFLQFGKLYYDRKGLPGLQAILLRHTRLLADQLRSYHQMLSKIFLLCAYLVVLFLISWVLTLITLGLFLLVTSFYVLLYNKMKKMSWKEEQHKYQLDQKTFNIMSCIPLVKACAREAQEEKLFSKVSSKESELAFEIQKKMQFVNHVQNIASLIALLIIITSMSFFFSHGMMVTASQFIVFFIVVRRMEPCFAAIGDFGLLFARSSAQSDAVFDILENDADKHIVQEGGVKFSGFKNRIEFKNLNFSYKEGVNVLDDVTFSVEKGKKTAIVGSTGSGKTTLINLLLRFYDCAPDSIFIDDCDIREYTLQSLRKQIAVVSQDVLLFNDTLRLNIGYGFDDMEEDVMMDAVQRACFHEAVSKFPDHLETVIGERGVQLSGGEKQRASIARALLKTADIFILDEASSALDVRTERLIHNAIHDATKDKTLIIISHRLSTIKGADHIVVLDEGRIVEQGTFKELIAGGGLFYEYWQEQRLDDVM